MANGDVTLFTQAKKNLGNGSLDWDTTNTLKVMLVNTGIGATQRDTWEDKADVAGEVSLTNYTARGVAITPSAPSVTGTEAFYDATDAAWTNLGAGTVSHGIIYEDTGVDATSLLYAYVELTTQPNGGNYTIAWNASGVFKIS